MPVDDTKAMLAVYASSAGAVGQRAAVRAVCKGIEFDVFRLVECETAAEIVWEFGWAEGSNESDFEPWAVISLPLLRCATCCRIS
jgi:hypothetical protein